MCACSKSEPKGEAINKLPADKVRELAAEAYMMSYPLVMNYATMYRQVANTGSAEYTGGFGEMRHDGCYTPENKDNVSPNNDTPSSWAGADLGHEPWGPGIPEAGADR